MNSPLDLIQLSGVRRVPIIRQTEAAECGLACIAMIGGYHGFNTDLTALRSRFSISLNGSTLKTLIGISHEIGFNTRPLKVSPELLTEVAQPAILHWDLKHFVVLSRVERRVNRLIYHVIDPGTGAMALSEAEFSQHFTGVALELIPSERFERRTERVSLRISQMWSRMTGLGSTLGQIIVLSIVMQIFAFATPFYLQLAIDMAVPTFDIDFLKALAIGFGGMAVINLATSILRDVISLKFGSILSYQLITNLFRKLLRLPIGYFEKRHTGDVISRFDSTQPIADLFSHGILQATLDGVMAIGTLALMYFYSPLLASITLLALAIYVVMRMVSYNALRQANTQVIGAAAAESSTMIETVRGMAAIKLFARESNRQRIWQNRRADVVNSKIRTGRMQIWFDGMSNAVTALENVIFVYLAVKMTIDGRFTIGMIFAFQSYKTQFLNAATRLVGQVVQFRLLDVHLDRIADIALTPGEEDDGEDTESASRSRSGFGKGLMGAIDIQGVHFAYGWGEREVLKGVDLAIAPGETIALIGPSGGGKTTLMKLLLGFYPPDQGKISVDGDDLKNYGLRRYRSQIGAVLQDDVLYEGTISDNIAFFDAEIDLERVHRVATLACIHEEIMAMPMAYESMIGNMGLTLSGGQKQRVLLARALYSDPKILMLDEGTAHLDLQTEAKVNQAIAGLGITRIIIAHRPETIRMAERIVALIDGRTIEMPRDMPAPPGGDEALVPAPAAFP